MIRIEFDIDLFEKAENFLKSIKPLLYTNDYTFRQHEKNLQFDRQYNLTNKQKINIIMSLEAKDCIKIEPNNNPRYKDSEVYVFLRDETLVIYGEEDQVKLYIKMYQSELPSYNKVIVISFHQEGVFD